MSDITPTSDPYPSASPVDIAATGTIPRRWSAEIRQRADALSKRTGIPLSDVADELEARGRTALWIAARTYKSAHGVPFEHYARRIVRRAMVSGLRFVGRQTSSAYAISLDDPNGLPSPLVSEEVLADEACAADERRELVRTWVSTCPPRLRRVYELIYVRGLTQREAATHMRISQPRVSHYHRRLLQIGLKDLRLVRAA